MQTIKIEIGEVTRHEVDGVVKGRLLLRTHEDGRPRTLDGKIAMPVTRYVVTRDGEQVSRDYATREEAEAEARAYRAALEDDAAYGETYED